MKRKLLLEFADYLEHNKRPFNMRCYDKCVISHAMKFLGVGQSYDRNMFDTAFGLPDYVSSRIYGFHGVNWNYGHKLTRKVAAEVIRHLARTGKVNWGRAYKKIKGKPLPSGALNEWE